MKLPFGVLIATMIVLPNSVFGQYWGERVLEKSFEQTDFFFTPSYLNPYGIGSFKNATPGLLNDPLLEYIVNPARVRLDSLQWAYLYTDFRAARTITEEPSGYYPIWAYDGARVASDMIYYPRVYLNTRRELEPVFSGALMSAPAPEDLEGLLVGATYQLILQDDKYYSVPQDIYRTTAGYDYSGERAAAASDLPIVDKYSGSDNMNQTGHFLNAFASYVSPFGLDVGAKVSRVTFTRSGSIGSSNLWEHAYHSTSTSFWMNMEGRGQEYAHWDVAGGIRYHLSPKLAVGGTFGYLWGEVTQNLHQDDSSYYANSSSSGGSYYLRSGDTDHNWLHEGKTTYFGFDLTARPAPPFTVNLQYRRERASVGITLASGILDTSYSTYTWTDTATYTSYSQSFLSDVRGGGGEQVRTQDRVMGALLWKINDNIELSLGAVLEWNSTSTTTTESVLSASRSFYWSTHRSWDSRYSQAESKDLVWSFAADRTSFQIPVFMNIRASEVIGVMLGLNRTMTQWRIDDRTLALFRYRVMSTNGGVTRQENFGERYTAPTEEVTDVRTTFLAGVSLNATRAFQIRLLMVPNFVEKYDGTELEQLQWWIGLRLAP
jgi:hypothetical protein